MMFKLLPLAIFLVVVAFLAKGLSLDPGKLPSALIDKPAPAFELPTFAPEGEPFKTTDMSGKVWLLNVWASWCGPVITDLASTGIVPVVGLNYKDGPAESEAWLKRFGNPFEAVLADREGKVGIDWGVYGVPETFIIDKAGRVRYKHVGPLSAEELDETLRPIIDELLDVSS